MICIKCASRHHSGHLYHLIGRATHDVSTTGCRLVPGSEWGSRTEVLGWAAMGCGAFRTARGRRTIWRSKLLRCGRVWTSLVRQEQASGRTPATVSRRSRRWSLLSGLDRDRICTNCDHHFYPGIRRLDMAVGRRNLDIHRQGYRCRGTHPARLTAYAPGLHCVGYRGVA